MVGRPREFDIDKALSAAMAAFWAKGYEATSLTDLMSATGLHKGSLYRAFGDKHQIFIKALKLYLADMRRSKDELLASAESPLAGLRAVAHGMIDIVDDSPCPKGCMAIHALVEVAPHDPEVEAIMNDHIARMRRSVEEAVAQAQAAGEISTERPPALHASLMLTFIAGLGTMMKGPVSKAQAHKLVDEQLEALM